MMWKAVLSDLNDLERPIHCTPNTSSSNNRLPPPPGSVATPLYAVKSNNEGNESPIARIPLQDCLSCTGCLTLAEEQLSVKSRNQVVQLCNSWLAQGQQVLFSLQPQTIAAIAVHFGMDYSSAAQKIACICKQKGVGWVTDQKEARYLCLLETWEELVQRYDEKKRLPLIISACPAWVSFMKRKRPEWMECLSQVYSPSLMTGYLWKKRNPNIKHVAVMSCYEMAVQTQTQAMEYPNGVLVDALWTTQQLIQWLEWNDKKKEDMLSIPLSPLDTTWISLESDFCKGTSHGYFWMAVDRWIDKIRVEQEENNEHSPPHIEWNTKPEDGNNMQQVCIQWKSSPREDGKMKRVGMILAYGYQSLQRLLKRGGLDSDVVLVEAMACPHGCINGSGQLLTNEQQPKTPKEQREYLQALVNNMKTSVTHCGKNVGWSEWKNSVDGQQLSQAYDNNNNNSNNNNNNARRETNQNDFACPPQLYWNMSNAYDQLGKVSQHDYLDW